MTVETDKITLSCNPLDSNITQSIQALDKIQRKCFPPEHPYVIHEVGPGVTAWVYQDAELNHSEQSVFIMFAHKDNMLPFMSQFDGLDWAGSTDDYQLERPARKVSLDTDYQNGVSPGVNVTKLPVTNLLKDTRTPIGSPTNEWPLDRFIREMNGYNSRWERITPDYYAIVYRMSQTGGQRVVIVNEFNDTYLKGIMDALCTDYYVIPLTDENMNSITMDFDGVQGSLNDYIRDHSAHYDFDVDNISISDLHLLLHGDLHVAGDNLWSNQIE